MKRLLLVFLITTISSCTSSEKNVECAQQKAIEQIKSGMNDPDSFEFISFEKFDSLTIQEMNENLNGDKIKRYDELIAKSEGVMPKSEIDEMKTERDKLKNEFSHIEGQDPSDIGMYHAYLHARGNNALGAKIKTKYFVAYYADEDCTITKIKEE